MYRNIVFALSMLAASFVAGPSAAFEGPATPKDPVQLENLQNIRAALQVSGASWEAGDTSVSSLTDAEFRNLLGYARPPVPKAMRAAAFKSPPQPDAPLALDWRSNGGNFVTPVRDQLSCGSCWAFASTAGLESRTLISRNLSGVDLDLSEQSAVSCSGNGDCSGGWLIDNFFVTTGIPIENCYKYLSSNGNCANACADWQQHAYKITGYTWAVPPGTQQDAETIKAAIRTYGPVMAALTIYTDFEYYRTGVYAHTYGTIEGYHTVLLIGYDDASSCFIAKNSWGMGWGEQGFFRIAYSELNSGVDLGYEVLAYNGASSAIYSTITDPVDGGAVGGPPTGGTYTVQGLSVPETGKTIQRVEVSTDSGGSWSDATDTSGGSFATWRFDWHYTVEGPYTILARATGSDAKVETPGKGVKERVDLTSPTAAITCPPDGSAVGGTTFVISGAASDGTGSGISGVEVSTDGGTNWYPATGGTIWRYSWTLPVPGGYSLLARAVDAAGNVGSPGTAVTVTVDPARPVSAVTSPTDGATVGGIACTITGTAADHSGTGLSSVEVSTDGGVSWHSASDTSGNGSWSSWAYSWPLGTSGGPANLRCRATDNNGHVETPGHGFDVTASEMTGARLWSWQSGYPDWDAAYAGTADADGNSILAGFVYGNFDGSTTAGGFDVGVVKLGPDGTKLWSRQIGTPGSDMGRAVAADTSGNIYIAGNAGGPLDGNAWAGDSDIFVTKFDRDGNRLWTRQSGTTGADSAGAVVVDGSGNIYIAGYATGSLNGSPYAGSADAVLLKYDPSGSLLYSREFGTAGSDVANAVTVDPSGNVYVAGITDGPLDGNSNEGGGGDYFVVKFDTAGNRLWTRVTGTFSYETAKSVAADSTGVYVAGYTQGRLGEASYGGYDAFIAKYDPAGALLWTRQQGTDFTDKAFSVAAGPRGIYLAGYTSGPLDGGVNNGAYDCFVSKYDRDGNRSWTRLYGGPVDEFGEGISIDERGSVLVAGLATGSGGIYDMYAVKLFAGGVAVNTDAAFTPSTAVTVNPELLDPSGITDMQFSNDGSFPASPWLPYAASAAWNLVPGNGPKTVYARYRDAAGNVSAIMSDDIYLDGAPPSSTITSPADGSYVRTYCTLTGTASDTGGSGLARVEVSTDGGTTWMTASGHSTWSYAWAVPAAGTFWSSVTPA